MTNTNKDRKVSSIITVPFESAEELRAHARKQDRKISQQFKVIMDFYRKYKNKIPS